MTNNTDILHRYLFDQHHVRGELVQLQQCYQDIIANHDYPQPVRQLLGELLAATCLLTATIKFDGDISVQLQGDGAVGYMVINGNHKQEMRGIARLKQETQAQGLKDLIGKGNMIITIRPSKGEAYQGIVALEADNLADCLAHYFEASEQIPTKIWLFHDEDNQKVAGSLVQFLPGKDDTDGGDKEKQQQDFQHICQLTNTIKAQEIFSLDAEELLYRLYHQENVRLFDPQSVKFVCGCSEKKCLSAIAQIEPSELKSIVEEKGNVSMTCEYCKTTYAFDEQRLTEFMTDKQH